MIPIHQSGHLTTQSHREVQAVPTYSLPICASIESVIPDSITINGFANDHSIRKSFDADSRDHESQLIILMVGHGCQHSLLDGHYASEVEPRQD